MASSGMIEVFENAPDQGTPLVATVNPVTGEIVITHANAVDPVTGAPIYMTNANLSGFLDGQIFGVDKKLIALGVLAFLFLRK